MILIPALAPLLLPLVSSTVIAMNDRPEALKIDVLEESGAIEVRLIGNSPQAQQVSYTLEVKGQSTSRHRGKTTLEANTSTILSTVKVSAGEKWCVRLIAEEGGREPYEILAGDCARED